MNLQVSSVLCGGAGAEFPGKLPAWSLVNNQDNHLSPCEAHQKILDRAKSEIVVYIHDDVTVHDENWLDRIVEAFENPKCVAVGLGGATGLGRPDLYRKPYNIWNLARSDYASNQTDAETHGRRTEGTHRVAVLDAFCMAVSVPWLRSRGGWPVVHLSHHCLDLWLACEAARDGKEIWMVGASCTHHGGGTSTKPVYPKAKWLQGGTMEEEHIRPHLWIYNEYRDVLPIFV